MGRAPLNRLGNNLSVSVQQERGGENEESSFATTKSVNYSTHEVEGGPGRPGTPSPSAQRRRNGPRPKYRHLLEDREVRLWYDNVCRGSKITADVYLRRLGFLCNAKGIADPNELVHRARASGERWAYSFLMDIVTEMEANSKAGSYTESTLKAVKSWLAHNAVEVKGRIKIKGARDTPTLKDKHALSGPELALFLSNAPPQTRCAAVIIAEAGLRLESVGNYDGSDSLRIGDLPEMEIVKDDLPGSEPRVSFSKVPTMIVVRPELSKAGHQYLTFLTAEGCRYLAEYLLKRMKSGERLDSSTPLITPGNIKQRKNLFVRSMLVSDLIRKRLKGCKINCRPYDLRATFATQMMLAESKGQIIRDYRVFFMGHKGDIEHTYTTNRHMLPSKVI